MSQSESEVELIREQNKEYKAKERERDKSSRTLALRLWSFFLEHKNYIPLSKRQKLISSITKEEEETLEFLKRGQQRGKNQWH